MMQSADSPDLYFGTAGWSYSDWEGIVYDRKADGLETVSSILDCAEVNSTFYRVPDQKMVSGWLRKVEGRDNFMFLVKVFRAFTHETSCSADKRKGFLSMLSILKRENRLGPVLAQFPFYFKRDKFAEQKVKNIAEIFGDCTLFAEFRHTSWLDPSVPGRLREWNTGLCNIDIPGGEKTFNRTQEMRENTGYLRLHGRNSKAWFRRGAQRDEKYDYLYTDNEIGGVIERLKGIGRKAARVFVIANNHYRGKAPANALELKAAVTGERVHVPAQMMYEYPHLKKYADSKTLF